MGFGSGDGEADARLAMGLEAIFKVLGDIATTADATGYGVVGALVLAAFVLMHAMLPVKDLAYLFAPGLFWGGLVGIYIAKISGFVVSAEEAVNSTVAATAGMVGALFVLVLLTRLLEALVRIRKPLAAPVLVNRRIKV